MSSKQMMPEAQGEHIAKVTFGIQDTAMPYWGEFLPWQDRWDAIQFLMGAWMAGTPMNDSVYGSGQVPANYVTVSSDVYVSEGHTISPTHGADLYSQYCATCHGSQGQGDGPGNEGSASGGPAPFPSGMGEGYIYWRIWEGVPESIMPPFQWYLSGNDVWDITVYLQTLTGTGGGG
jgi:cytochrome c553